jgi:hypothetical protein
LHNSTYLQNIASYKYMMNTWTNYDTSKLTSGINWQNSGHSYKTSLLPSLKSRLPHE